MKITVLAGGISVERDVSMASGVNITNALKKLGHKAILVDTFFGIDDTCDIDSLFENEELLPPYSINNTMPDIDKLYKERGTKYDSEIGPNVINACLKADICFIALHGGIGENGKLQALLDINKIKYTGTDSISSALAMHKGFTKQLFMINNIPCADGIYLTKDDEIPNIEDLDFTYPVVVKVCNGGSSIGVYIANNNTEYQESIKEAFALENEILIEKYIKGREFAAPVLDGQALPLIEIIPKDGWFDYEHKYQDGATSEICPAELDEKTTQKIQTAAVHAVKALGISVYARPDFLLDKEGNIYCVEVNTLPGMTQASLFPKACNVIGLSYEDMVDRILKLSLEKHEK